MNRTWTMDELIDAYERKGFIDPPFSPDERALAYSVAAAWHFATYLEELPGRCPDAAPARTSLGMGIQRVLGHRKEQAAGTTSHETSRYCKGRG